MLQDLVALLSLRQQEEQGYQARVALAVMMEIAVARYVPVVVVEVADSPVGAQVAVPE